MKRLIFVILALFVISVPSFFCLSKKTHLKKQQEEQQQQKLAMEELKSQKIHQRWQEIDSKISEYYSEEELEAMKQQKQVIFEVGGNDEYSFFCEWYRARFHFCCKPLKNPKGTEACISGNYADFEEETYEKNLHGYCLRLEDFEDEAGPSAKEFGRLTKDQEWFWGSELEGLEFICLDSLNFMEDRTCRYTFSQDEIRRLQCAYSIACDLGLR